MANILIIDDEMRLLHNLQILLSRAGYTVVTATDETEGIQCLQRTHFDVVITDLVMHGSDGFETLECLAAYAPDIPIIVITGYASAGTADEVIRRGAYDIVAKPFELKAIKRSIERALAKV